MSCKILSRRALGALVAVAVAAVPAIARAGSTSTNPYEGITCITRTETAPRAVTMHVALIDLAAPGLSFAVSPHAGTAETYRQTTTDFLNSNHADLGINVAFFDPVIPTDFNVNVAGLIVSQGNVVSNFDDQPCHTGGPIQSYAIVPFAPALNIDSANHAAIVHRDAAFADNQHILESVGLWNAVSGSAQIITDGTVTVPVYKDASNPTGLLLTGTSSYSNANSWYNAVNARTAIGFTQSGTLVLFTVDKAGGSNGMTVGEVANILFTDYHCYEALNLDGGGSTCMALRDPTTQLVSTINASADAAYPSGRPEGVNLAVFAAPVPEPASLALVAVGAVALLARRRRV